MLFDPHAFQVGHEQETRTIDRPRSGVNACPWGQALPPSPSTARALEQIMCAPHSRLLLTVVALQSDEPCRTDHLSGEMLARLAKHREQTEPTMRDGLKREEHRASLLQLIHPGSEDLRCADRSDDTVKGSALGMSESSVPSDYLDVARPGRCQSASSFLSHRRMQFNAGYGPCRADDSPHERRVPACPCPHLQNVQARLELQRSKHLADKGGLRYGAETTRRSVRCEGLVAIDPLELCHTRPVRIDLHHARLLAPRIQVVMHETVAWRFTERLLQAVGIERPVHLQHVNEPVLVGRDQPVALL
jgi:hypothetical protein